MQLVSPSAARLLNLKRPDLLVDLGDRHVPAFPTRIRRHEKPQGRIRFFRTAGWRAMERRVQARARNLLLVERTDSRLGSRGGRAPRRNRGTTSPAALMLPGLPRQILWRATGPRGRAAFFRENGVYSKSIPLHAPQARDNTMA